MGAQRRARARRVRRRARGAALELAAAAGAGAPARAGEGAASRSRRCRSTGSRDSSSAGSISPPTRGSTGSDGAAAALAQLYGLARPAEGWERDYLPARLEQLRRRRAGAAGGVGRAGVGGGAEARTRRRGGRRRSGASGSSSAARGGSGSRRRRDDAHAERQRARGARGAAHAGRVVHGRRVGGDAGWARSRRATRCASWWRRGSSTNDTIDALRDVLRWQPVFPVKRRDEPDPTRWLPGGLHAVGASHRAAAGEPAAAGEVAASRPRGGVGAWGGTLVAGAHAGHPGTGDGRAGAGRADRAPVAGAVRDRVARLVAARAAGGGVARDLPRAQAARVPRRGAARATSWPAWPGRSSRCRRRWSCCARRRTGDEAPVVLRGERSGEPVHAAAGGGDDARSAGAPARGGGAARDARRPDRAGCRGARDEAAGGGGGDAGGGARRGEGAGGAAGPRPGRTRAGRARVRDLVVETIDGERAAGSRWAEALREAGYQGDGVGAAVLCWCINNYLCDVPSCVRRRAVPRTAKGVRRVRVVMSSRTRRPKGGECRDLLSRTVASHSNGKWIPTLASLVRDDGLGAFEER